MEERRERRAGKSELGDLDFVRNKKRVYSEQRKKVAMLVDSYLLSCINS